MPSHYQKQASGISGPLTYLGSNISSTETDINNHIGKH